MQNTEYHIEDYAHEEKKVRQEMKVSELANVLETGHGGLGRTLEKFVKEARKTLAKLF